MSRKTYYQQLSNHVQQTLNDLDVLYHENNVQFLVKYPKVIEQFDSIIKRFEELRHNLELHRTEVVNNQSCQKTMVEDDEPVSASNYIGLMGQVFLKLVQLPGCRVGSQFSVDPAPDVSVEDIALTPDELYIVTGTVFHLSQMGTGQLNYKVAKRPSPDKVTTIESRLTQFLVDELSNVESYGYVNMRFGSTLLKNRMNAIEPTGIKIEDLGVRDGAYSFRVTRLPGFSRPIA